MPAVQLLVKSVDDDKRVITGIASTPTPDRMGDVVEPLGAKFTLPLPLLWQHDHKAPVGQVIEARATPEGVWFKATVARVTEPGRLKDRLDEAWQSIRAGLVGAVSVGFKSLDGVPLRNGSMRFTSWEWMELSLVTIPANSQAIVESFRGKSATAGADPITITDRLNRVNVEVFERIKTAVAEGARATAGPALKIHALSGIVDAFGLVTVELLREVARLERRLAEIEGRKMMSYRGVFSAGHAYEEGDAVTHRGSMWVCCSPTSGPPGEIGAASGCWRLAVRKGRDAHNARGVRNHEDN